MMLCDRLLYLATFNAVFLVLPPILGSVWR